MHKTEDIYTDVSKNIETKFDPSNYKLWRRLPQGKKKEVIALIKDVLGGKVVTKFVGLRPNMHSSVTYEDCNDKNK